MLDDAFGLDRWTESGRVVCDTDDDLERLLVRVTRICAKRQLPADSRDPLDVATEALLSMTALERSCPSPRRADNLDIDRLGEAIDHLRAELLRSAGSVTHMAGLLDSLDQPVVLLDAGGRVSQANPIARRLFGDDVLGAAFAELFCDDPDARLLAALACSAAPTERMQLRAVRAPDRHLLVSVSPLRSPFGDVDGYACIVTDITDQITIQNTLARAADLAEGHARARTAFLTYLSHEIRTPLNGVVGMATLLQHTPLTDDQRRLVACINECGEQLVSLVDQVVAFSAVDPEQVGSAGAGKRRKPRESTRREGRARRESMGGVREWGLGCGPAGSDLDGSHVLLVEDNAINQKVALRMLAGLGVTADLARDGAEAVSMCTDKHYDLILMDCQMPGMDGFAATRTLRVTEPRGRHIPIIALTAHAFAEERSRCFAAGMDDFLAKPVRPDKLERALRKWLTHGRGRTRPLARARSEAPCG